jgi:hypothetical protein
VYNYVLIFWALALAHWIGRVVDEGTILMAVDLDSSPALWSWKEKTKVSRRKSERKLIKTIKKYLKYLDVSPLL